MSVLNQYMRFTVISWSNKPLVILSLKKIYLVTSKNKDFPLYQTIQLPYVGHKKNQLLHSAHDQREPVGQFDPDKSQLRA